jgi:type I restriction enzyme S subunit
MMETSTVTANLLSPRLDAEYYSPKVLPLVKSLRDKGHPVLGRLLASMKRHPMCYGFEQWDNSAVGRIPYFKGEDLYELSLNHGSSFILEAYFDDYPSAQVLCGEMIMSVRGTIGRVSVCRDRRGLCSPNTIVLVPKPGLDSEFCAAFLSCRQGQILINREVSGTVQDTITEDAIANIQAVQFSAKAQSYIGEKVREAERLREHARTIKKHLQLDEISLIPVTQPARSKEKGWRISGAALNEIRLDSKFYRGHYVETERLTSGAEFHLLSSVVTRFRYGASIEADYVPTGEGVLFLRGNDFDKNRIDRPHCVDIRSNWLSEIGDNLLKPGMVLLTRSGTVGIAVAVPEDMSGAAYGSFIISLELAPRWNPVYVAWYLNSWLGRMQTERLENGAVQLNINIQELGSVRIWKASDEVQADIEKKVLSFNLALDSVHSLTTGSKLLVEALIDGKVTEAELVAAQEALERGDHSADRVLLRRLTRKGIDVSGEPPLFPDLDALYAQMTQTEPATE